MSSSFHLPRLKDISITKKLYFVVGAMALLIAIELFTLWFAIHTLSSVRALVGAEGLWSKAQKDGIYQLEKYYRTHDNDDYLAFKNFMLVPIGDHKTRLELIKQKPDLEIARQGFLEGRNHPDDIDGMIKLLRRFYNISYINKAIGYWSEGDTVIAQLLPIGESLHAEINSASPSEEKLKELIESIKPINQHLTKLEDNFSFVLGEGSRWLENLILKLLFIVALTVEITGLIMSFSVSRGIARGLKEINRAANRVSNGDLSERAIVFSKDEIGQVATAMNQMTEQLIHSNHELGQFAYVASHDLQEPLRKIQSFANRISEKEKDNLSDAGKDYFIRMQNAANRMQSLINNLLTYSRNNAAEINLQETDLNDVLTKAKDELNTVIEEKSAIIESDTLPVLRVTAFQFQQLFINLLANSIKYHKPELHPKIKITYAVVNGKETPEILSREGRRYHKISFSDDGIGFEEQYSEKIFQPFQRLHGRNEYSGTGIGLTICKKIVENHNGIITATGKPDTGSTFDIFLPVS